MKFAIITFGFTLLSIATYAKGADTIIESDPTGIILTIVAVPVVLLALIALYLFIYLFGLIMKRIANKKVASKKGVVPSRGDSCNSVENGEIIAAISLAIKLNKAELHDKESEVITINSVARAYSPWSSKIHGLTHMPEHLRK